MEAKGPGPTKSAGASSSHITRPPLPPRQLDIMHNECDPNYKRWE